MTISRARHITRALPVAVLAGAALLAACAAPAKPDGMTYFLCTAAIVSDAASECTVTSGHATGAVLTPGRSRNVVQVVEAGGERHKQYAGTYFDCIDSVSTRVLDVCLVVDGKDAGREMTLDVDNEPVLGPAVAR